MTTMHWKKDAAGRLAAEWATGEAESAAGRYRKPVKARFQIKARFQTQLLAKSRTQIVQPER